MIAGRTLVRGWGTVTALAGAAMAVAPEVAAELVAGPQSPPVRVVQILGVRELGQGALLVLRPTRTSARLCLAVDITHLATMVAALRVFPRYRRSEIISGSAALGSILLGVGSLRRLGR